MEIKRAIEILDPEHREHYESLEPVNEACRMGMEALKKQVPMKICPQMLGKVHGKVIYDTAKCPVCHREFMEDLYGEGPDTWESDYCPDCGQRLDWGENDD